MSLEFTYALHSGTNDYFYVGRTNDLARRFEEHRRSGNLDGTLKERKIAELISLGKSIEMKMLDCGDPDEMMSAEELWKVNLEAEGHELTNEQPGSGHPYLGYTITERVPTVWRSADFESADWVKGRSEG
jgi:predicted GIY-YIG superfamily endonuclease